MIESVVIRCIKHLNPTLTHIVGGQNGYNPKKIFIIAEEVDSYLVGTATRTLTSRTGVWLQQQTKEHVVRVGVQGTVSPELSEIAEILQLMLDTPFVRQAFQDEGYTLKVDKQIIPLNMIAQNTDQYKRYSLTLRLSTSISIEVKQPTMKGVQVKGTFVEDNGYKLGEYEETIPEDS
ncbi:hypothetical protein vBAbaMD22_27 [Acinetobacter phage vB_AbaM_D22]|nr:hypothetical protein vBAbaMD22_27 [Acinetobacter phage vB_AbaM_D22]